MWGRQQLVQERLQQLQEQKRELLVKQQLLQQRGQQQQQGNGSWLRRALGRGAGGSSRGSSAGGSPSSNTAAASLEAVNVVQEQEAIRQQLLVTEGQLQQLNEAEADSGTLTQLQANAQQLIVKLSGLAQQLDSQLGEASKRLALRSDEASRLRTEVTALRRHAPPMSSAAAAQALVSVVELMSGLHYDD